MQHQIGHEDGPRTYKYDFKPIGLAILRFLLSCIPWLIILLGIVVDLFAMILLFLPTPTGRIPGQNSSAALFFLMTVFMSICPGIAWLCSFVTSKFRKKPQASPAIKTIALIMIGFAVLIAMFA